MLKCLAVLFLCSLQCCWAQVPVSPLEATYDRRPRLVVWPRLNLNGGGFQPVSFSGTIGTGMEMRHLVWEVSGTYNAAKKVEWTDLKDNINPHGNVRSASVSLFYRTDGGWLFGAQGYYAQLRTTLFRKIGEGISVGVGKDFMGSCPNCFGPPVSMRFKVMYSLPVHCYTQNNFHCVIPTVDVEQGAAFEYTVPCPCETQRHVFWKVTANVSIIKTSEHGSYTHDGGAAMGPIFRF